MTRQPGNPTSDVRAGEELDWQRLDSHLKSVLTHLEGEPQISQFTGGASNLTYRSTDQTSDSLAKLRRGVGLPRFAGQPYVLEPDRNDRDRQKKMRSGQP